MNRRLVLTTPCVIILISMLTFALSIQSAKSESVTIRVPDDYPTIQEAVDAATDGDTVEVAADAYYEHVTINKSLTLIGEDQTTTIIDGNYNGSVITITADNVRLSGFTIQSGYEGIHIENSRGNIISDNIITSNEFEGIVMDNSTENVITDNLISLNSWGGIYLTYAGNNVISGNSITSNDMSGIHIEDRSNGNTISGNRISTNTYDGIRIWDSHNTLVFGNTISSNSLSGIDFFNASDSNFYHNNFVDNTEQINSDGSSNTWDNDAEGNYWSNYGEVDSDHDGIGDTPHVIDSNNQDNHPLMGVFSSFETSLDYSVNVISNSTIEDFAYFESNNTIETYVSNMTVNQAFGFCRVCIPRSLMAPPYVVRIDDGYTEVLYFDDAVYENSTHGWIYFAYEHSTREVVIRSLLPTISILSPENKTYPVRDVPLTLIVDKPTSWMGYSLDSQMNITISGNTTLVGLSDNTHSLIVYANDTNGNMGYSRRVYFSIDTKPPNIQILSPENKTYTTNSVSLNFTVDETTSWISLSLDGQTNETIVGTTIISDLSDGLHSLIVYAEDAIGNIGASEIVYFTINTQQVLPFPLAIEWLIVAIIIVVVILGTTSFVLYRRKKASSNPSSPSTSIYDLTSFNLSHNLQSMKNQKSA